MDLVYFPTSKVEQECEADEPILVANATYSVL